MWNIYRSIIDSIPSLSRIYEYTFPTKKSQLDINTNSNIAISNNTLLDLTEINSNASYEAIMLTHSITAYTRALSSILVPASSLILVPAFKTIAQITTSVTSSIATVAIKTIKHMTYNRKNI